MDAEMRKDNREWTRFEDFFNRELTRIGLRE
jgi:hypothetical protein